jgi:endonuclease V-like protein UPF0215 family
MPAAFSNVVAFDDAPFAPADRGDVQVVGAVYAGLRLDGVLVGRVRRDGTDATRRLADLIARSRFAEHLQLVMLQSIALAGFNVVDLNALHARLGLPVLAVARRVPDLDAIRAALALHVPGGRRKWRLIAGLQPMERAGRVYVQRVGLTAEQARHTVERFALYGHMPEPLRTAHLIAGALGRGQSRGPT